VPPEATGALQAPVADRASGGAGGAGAADWPIGTHAAAPTASTTALSQRARRRKGIRARPARFVAARGDPLAGEHPCPTTL
jgi:hypothetical protein